METGRRQRYVDKLALLESRCRLVAEWSQGTSPQSLRTDDRTRLAIYKALQECIEVCTDVCAMRLRDCGRSVKDDHANIDSLVAAGDLDQELAALMHEANGLRNRLVHSYAEIRDDLVLAFTATRMVKFATFARRVRQWLD